MSASTVSVAPTMAVLIQEAMAGMPDTFNTKKEIEEYFKNAMKEIVMKKKEEEKANKPEKPEKPKKAAKKPKKEDTDSNDEEKPEKPKKAAKKPKKEDTSNDEEKPEKPKKAEKKPKKEDTSNDEEKLEKPKKAEKKPKKEKELDEDGNEIKKPPTEYIIFKKEMAIKIKDQFPDLNYQKAQKKINDLWKIHKNGHTEEF